MDSFHAQTAAHQAAIDTLAKVKEAEKQIQRTTVPIKNEHGRVVGHRLVRVRRTEASQSVIQIPRPILEPMKKQCTKCGTTKPLTDFSPSKIHKGGHNSVCKACVAAYARARYAAKRSAVSAKKAVVESLTCAQWVAPLTTSAPIAPYNRKGFLLPDSIRSCASYHAKILESGEYMFRIHDCVTGIRLRGYLNDPQEVTEAIGKLEALAAACSAFANHIKGLLQ